MPHRRNGIVAVLATGIVAVTADPVCADPPPTLPPIISIELLPGRGPATTTPTPVSATSATATSSTKTAAPTTTPATAVKTTKTTGSKGSAEQRGAAVTHSPTPTPRPTLRPAAPAATQDAPAAVPQAAEPGSNPDQHDRWAELATLILVAFLAASFGRRHRKGHAAALVDRAAGRPEFADPEGVARRRLYTVE